MLSHILKTVCLILFIEIFTDSGIAFQADETEPLISFCPVKIKFLTEFQPLSTDFFILPIEVSMIFKIFTQLFLVFRTISEMTLLRFDLMSFQIFVMFTKVF